MFDPICLVLIVIPMAMNGFVDVIKFNKNRMMLLACSDHMWHEELHQHSVHPNKLYCQRRYFTLSNWIHT